MKALASYGKKTTAFTQFCNGSSRLVLLLLVFLAGLGVGAFCIYFRAQPSSKPITTHEARQLSIGTKSILNGLESPVELRFYSMVNQPSVNEEMRHFANRVNELISAFETESGGKIQVIRKSSASRDEMNAASADGLVPFNLDKGEPCYLGIAVVRGENREVLPQLSLDWEDALEFDITRAIMRVAKPKSTPGAVTTADVTPAATEAMSRLVPNPSTTSLEEGRRIIREAALQELKNAVVEMDAKIKKAEERFTKATRESDQQEALKELQTLQSAKTEKLKQIAADAQSQVAAFEKLKNNTP
jgi:hypothetical protein